jgi:hypothetical protein
VASGTGAGLGTILFPPTLIGWAADHYSFQPVLVATTSVPLAATLIVCLLVPTRTAGQEQGSMQKSRI